MKKIFTMAMLVICLSASAQELFNPSYTEREIFRNEDIVFRQIDEHTWEGNGNLMAHESVYLIEGEERAVLIDAGTKIKNLDKIVACITSKPVTLVATHVHPDHTGEAINSFSTIYINPADTVNMAEFMPNYGGTVLYLKDGDILDLGFRNLEVVFTPGHTLGSTTFIDREFGYGFSGDSFGSGNLLLFTDFSTLLSTCQKMDDYMEKNVIKLLYPGHYMGKNVETRQRIRDLITLSEDILTGKRHGKKNLHPMLDLDLIISDFGVRINYNQSKIK